MPRTKNKLHAVCEDGTPFCGALWHALRVDYALNWKNVTCKRCIKKFRARGGGKS